MSPLAIRLPSKRMFFVLSPPLSPPLAGFDVGAVQDEKHGHGGKYSQPWRGATRLPFRIRGRAAP